MEFKKSELTNKMIKTKTGVSNILFFVAITKNNKKNTCKNKGVLL
jgi:hypothetical protein